MIHKLYVNDSTKSMVLGHQGENNALVFLIDYTEWAEEFGSGTLSISNQRPGEDNPYPISLPHTGNVASWTISSNETAYPGDGYCQLIYSVGGTNVKSKVLKTAVLKSASGAGQEQDPWQGYIDAVAEYAAEVQSFKDDLTGGTNGQVWTKNSSGSGWKDPIVGEAPNDGKQYARKNKSWVEVEGGGGGATNHNDLEGRNSANAHPMSAISGLETALNAKTSKTYVDDEIADVRGDIPSEATVAGWGFTKNAGTYSKPSSGIPKSDLASAVQTSLGKADSAYQKPSSGVPKTDLASAVQTSLGKADSSVQEAPSDGNQYARKNGAWSVVEAGGGSGAYTVVITQSSGMQQTYTADKTYAEIYAAVIAGNVVLAKLQMAIPTKWRYLRCTGRYNRVIGLEEIIPAHLTFAGVEDDGVITECTIYDDESITVESIAYQNTISDLATIRSGAAAGATAVQPAALADKLSEPSTGLAVGKYFRIASIDENGHAILEAVDPPSVETKIKINGTVQTAGEDGYVDIPAGNNVFGVLRARGQSDGYISGVCYRTAGGSNKDYLMLYPTTEIQVASRYSGGAGAFPSINTNVYDYAVKRAMTDGVGAAWTDAEKQGALQRIGITVDENGFCKFGV